MTKFYALLLTLLLPVMAFAVTADEGIANPKVKWKFKTAGTIRGSVATDGTGIYFGSADGFLYAVNKNNGELLWKFQTNGSIAGAPALSASSVYFSSRDNFVYSLDSKTGKLLWKFEMKPSLKGYIEWEYYTSTPIIANTILYVASGDGNLYALNTTNGSLRWKFQTGGRIRATPLVTGETIYQPSNDGVVYVLSSNDGKLLWKFKTRGVSLGKEFGYDRTNLFTQPCLKNNTLMFGSRDGNVYGVNISTHQEKWNFTYGGTWAYSTVADSENVYVGWSTNKVFSAVDIVTGKEKWKFESGSVNYTTAAIQGNNVVFGSGDGKLYCLDKKTGAKKWAYETGYEIFSSPLISSNTIYFGCDDGYLYALEDGPKPFKAVYQPLSEGGNNSYPLLDKKIAPYLKQHGFAQLDSALLCKFLSNRITDKTPSVIVFAYDAIPQNIIGEYPESGMIRKYLEAGGKIIWLGSVPNMYAFTAKGKMMANVKRDLETPSRLLDVTFLTPEESGNYYCKATQQGLNWGLPSWLKTTHASVSSEKVTPLAFDEWGRVGPWMKKFNPRPGSGFVSCRPWAWDVPIRDADLELIYHLAIHELE